MKKIFCVLLVVIMLVLSGCTDKNDAEPVLLNDYLEKIKNFESVVHEYGEEQSRVLFGEKLVATVLYPETDIDNLDSEIRQWINNILSEYQIEASEEELKEAAELSVNYNSYMSSYGVVSVEFTGYYFASSLAHPTDFTATFAADTKSGEIIAIDRLLKEGKRNIIENTLVEAFGIEREFFDKDLLTYWVLEGDELKIILPRGEFLPMSDGTKEYSFSRKETADLFKENNEYVTETEKNKDKPTDTSPSIDSTIDRDKPMVALTFDDGPSAHTGRLLDIFEKYGGKGTFFVLGNTLDNRKETLKRMALQGHEIGNHSWSHRQFTNISRDEVKDQIMMTRAKIYEITGVDCKLVRPPYGACNDEIRDIGKELGVSFINWSVDTLDWKSKNADAVYNEIMKDVGDGHIILCHDLHKSTVDAMEKVVPDLIEKGYQLVTVSELLVCRGGEITAGKMYYKQAKS